MRRATCGVIRRPVILEASAENGITAMPRDRVPPRARRHRATGRCQLRHRSCTWRNWLTPRQQLCTSPPSPIARHAPEQRTRPIRDARPWRRSWNQASRPATHHSPTRLPMASPPVSDAGEHGDVRSPSPASPKPEPEPLLRELDVEMVRKVLKAVGGDVSALCAAACVSSTWLAASREQSLWRTPVLSGHVRRELSDDRLIWLAARAGAAGLGTLDLTGCPNISTYGVSDALLDKPPLEQLHVRGVWVPQYPNVAHFMAFAKLMSLKRCVRTPDGLDVDLDKHDATCAAFVGRWEDKPLCNRLCSEDDKLCSVCWIYMCDNCYRAAAASRDAPCEHICGFCFEESSECRPCSHCAEGHGRLGMLRRGRQALFCGDCLVKCSQPSCRRTLCRECTKTLQWFRQCVCGKTICTFCADRSNGCSSCFIDYGHSSIIGFGCRKLFCRDCIDEGRLRRVNWYDSPNEECSNLTANLCRDCVRRLRDDPSVEVEWESDSSRWFASR